MKIKNVTVAGGGTLGSQIAWQTAFKGFKVTVYDAFEKGIETCKNYHKEFADLFLKQRGASKQEIEDTLKRLSYTTDIEEAFKDADILSESIPENIDIKKDFYTKISKIAPKRTIFTTNTSSMIPSLFAEETGRPERFLGLHFATGGIWDTNIGEVMGHAGTSKEVYDQVIEFAEAIGMIAIPVMKENPGFVMNAVFIPFLIAGLDLVINGVASPEYVDKTWVISTRSTYGPCTFMDIIGMPTVYHVLDALSKNTGDDMFKKRADYIKENFLDKGKMGIASGEGFYKYPNPKYEDPDFLK